MVTKQVAGRIQSKHDTTENWNNARGFIPMKGEAIIYEDYEVVDGVNIPGIKVGDGTTYVQDLPFVGGYERDLLLLHISNASLHVSPEEKEFWNNKINTTDSLAGETLILTRN